MADRVRADGDGPHILAMNDTQQLIDRLEDQGSRVSTSLYALDLDRIRALAPDAIVLDVMFEGDTAGWKFLTLLELDRELCRLPVVLCTAAARTVAEEPMASHLVALGIEVVLKPFDLDQLLAALRRALDHSRRAARG